MAVIVAVICMDAEVLYSLWTAREAERLCAMSAKVKHSLFWEKFNLDVAHGGMQGHE